MPRGKKTHPDNDHHKAYVISINMGYGHERAAHGLLDVAWNREYIVANDYPGIPASEKALWQSGRGIYEKLSRLKSVPLVGEVLFSTFLDKNQEIPHFYPRRDLREPSAQVKQTYLLIEKFGICKHLIATLAENPKPLICTFFTPAFAAEYYDYPGDIYLTVCDADMSRAWVPMHPEKTRIKYFAPTGRVVERLKAYGVPAKNIYFTGFPLPKSMVGGASGSIINPDLLERLCHLDPNGIFLDRYDRILRAQFGARLCVPAHGKRPLTVMFAVGGAGAQKEIGLEAALSLAPVLKKRDWKFRFVAGTRPDVAAWFEEGVRKAGFGKLLGEQIEVLKMESRPEYFGQFDKALRSTDILWTKPSELSFFVGVGLPIIMAPPVGSQEEFNKRWLLQVGAGVSQNDPRYAAEWLQDWVANGSLARLAWHGFIEAPTHGTYRIEDILHKRKSKLEVLPLII